ncbi:hypothetical protein [uncultured Mucilaginibacter sp.]|uniref:hypothetical protein n=1 Tax=uncultured Mucilaginibacter sp. TaxID=797541 RepID=UPI0025EF2BEC|nr:hypothetical protein [uncultured Mucilaginibacter sp.]
METKPIITLIKYAAIGGNVLFVLWILFNAMDEGFRGTLPEKLSAVGLIGLLSVNSILLLMKSSQKQLKNQ